MARQGITRDQVFTAADALVGDGQQPTIILMRKGTPSDVGGSPLSH